MKKMTVMLLAAIMLAAIGFTGCPNGNGNDDPVPVNISRVEITGMPPMMLDATTPNPNAVVFLFVQLPHPTPAGAMGFAVMGGGVPHRPGVAVPEITLQGGAGTPLFNNVELMMNFLMPTGTLTTLPNAIPSVTVNSPGLITVEYTMASDGEGVAIPPNAREWRNFDVAGNTSAAGVLTLDWAAGQ